MSPPQAGALFVHAHPDDESIGNGVTMAACVAAGARVTLVTCTLGEEGEVIPERLAHLAAGRDDALGPYRAGELAVAMRAVGVTDHRFLGGRGRWRDSGMRGLPQNEHPAAFWQADLDTAGAALAEVIRETRPHVLITYDPDGGYRHPDHIQAHRVALRGAELAAPEHRIARVLWNCLPRSAAERGLAELRARVSRGAAPEACPDAFTGVATLSDLPGVVPDSHAVLAVEGTTEQRHAKAAAMAAHETQITVAPAPDATPGENTVQQPVFALSNGLAQPLWGTEWYRFGGGAPPPAGARDVFAGLDVRLGSAP